MRDLFQALTWNTELKVRNETANSTSSEPEGHWTIFSPQTAKPEETLDGPGGLTTYSSAPAPSPVTAVTQQSLENPNSEETESTTGETTSQTRQPKPIIQPTDISLIIPVTTDTVSDQTSFITVVPTAHVESSATYIFVPGPDTTTSRLGTPKMPHTEIAGSELDQPSKPTDSPDTHNGDDNSNQETPGPDDTTTWPTQAGVVVTSEMSGAGSDNSAGSRTQDTRTSLPVSAATGNPGNNGEAHASPTFVVDNTPVIAGGSPITVDGTTYSLAPSGSAVVVNGNTKSITTDFQGQIVPVQTTDASAGDSTASATDQALGGLSIASAGATTSGETAQETGEQQSNGSASGTQRATSTTSTSGGDAGATSTSGGSESAVQSDNVGALNSPTWPITAIVGAIGLLAVVV